MNYFINGYEELLINKEINKIKKNYQEINIFTEDYSEKSFNLKDFLTRANSYSFLSEKKLFILKNINFIMASKKSKTLDDYDLKLLTNFLKNTNEDNSVIFVKKYLPKEKPDSRKKAYKILNETCNVKFIDTIKPRNYEKHFDDLLIHYELKINNDVKRYLYKRLPLDLIHVDSEFNKLSTLNLEITYEIVNQLIPNILSETVFSLIDGIVYKNTSKALKSLEDLKIENDSPLALIANLSKQFKFMFRVKYLLSQNMMQKEIVSELKANEYYVENTIRKSASLSIQRIMRVVANLSELEILLKSDQNVDGYNALELYVCRECM